jgi:hypothetical protein
MELGELAGIIILSENTSSCLKRGGPLSRRFARPSSEFVNCVHSFNFYVVGIISPVFTDEENELPERLNDLHKVTQ